MGESIMNDALFVTTIECPICLNKINIIKIKTSNLRVISRDSDFLTYYKDVNPLFYDVYVCNYCGYSAQHDKFEHLTIKEEKKIQKFFSNVNWKQREPAKERDINDALDSFKLAIITLQARDAKASDFAKICLRIGWLYRLKKDTNKEKMFLEHAAVYYEEAYNKERFPIDKLDEVTCIYIIAEIYRRIEKTDKSIKWYETLVRNPKAKSNKTLFETSWEMIRSAKEKQV